MHYMHMYRMCLPASWRIITLHEVQVSVSGAVFIQPSLAHCKADTQSGLANHVVALKVLL